MRQPHLQGLPLLSCNSEYARSLRQTQDDVAQSSLTPVFSSLGLVQLGLTLVIHLQQQEARDSAGHTSLTHMLECTHMLDRVSFCTGWIVLGTQACTIIPGVWCWGLNPGLGMLGQHSLNRAAALAPVHHHT